jgi:3-oxoacyl-[acyl-carrier-protein] synthase II
VNLTRSNGEHRVVITGMGIVSALGIGRDAFWQGLQSLRSPVRRLSLFDTSPFKSKHAAWVTDWQPLPWIAPHRLKRMERFAQFSVVAARLAVEDAGIALTPATPNPRAGLSFGTAVGGFAYGETQHTAFVEHGVKCLPPALAVQVFGGSAQGNIAIECGLQGPCTTNANSCAAGNAAIGDALRILQRGDADVMLAGAGECPISPMIYAAFDNVNTMSRWDSEPAAHAYRPFHREREGFVIGEGAAVFVLETLEHAQQRGAEVLAEVLGYAITNEAHHMSTPRPGALRDAQLNTDSIDYVNCHASGTQANDANELTQVQAVFGSSTESLAISGTKPFTGHTLGAAGALELATCLLAMQHQWVPPTLHLDAADAACARLNMVPHEPQQKALHRVLTNSFGFGGIDTSLVIARMG